jgi:hypothetical protein
MDAAKKSEAKKTPQKAGNPPAKSGGKGKKGKKGKKKSAPKEPKVVEPTPDETLQRMTDRFEAKVEDFQRRMKMKDMLEVQPITL